MNKRILIIIILSLIVVGVVYIIFSSMMGKNLDSIEGGLSQTLDAVNGNDGPRDNDILDAFERDIVEERVDDVRINDGRGAGVGEYQDYSASGVASALENGDDVVLFFQASWCPTCRSLNSALEKESNQIPAGVSIFKVDYDSSSSLKSKYSVRYQHTLVQIDNDLSQIAKWSGSRNLKEIVSSIR